MTTQTPPAQRDTPAPRWHDVTGVAVRRDLEPPPSWWRPVAAVAVVACLVFAAVAVIGSVVARRAAEREAVNDAAGVTSVLADAVVQPALDDDLLATDPAVAAAARARLDQTLTPRLLSTTLTRVKLWTADGRIVYADDGRLIGRTFPLGDDERAALRERLTRAEVSDLSRPENQFEQDGADRLLEVYRPVWTPDGTTLLFETYFRYDAVTARSSQLWRGFGGITLSSMLLLLVAQAPLTWALIARLRRAQDEREAWLARAIAVSDGERRRIAATLHDGAVQDLAATAFAVAGAAERSRAAGDTATAGQLDAAAASVRTSIGGLRSLLVDIYPPSLRSAGLVAALRDLTAPLIARGTAVEVSVPETVRLPDQVEAVVFQVAREALRNVARHASARSVRLALTTEPDGPVVLTVDDDGAGFDVDQVLAAPREGHFGLRLMADLAAAAGGTLKLSSQPGAGTRWRLEVA